MRRACVRMRSSSAFRPRSVPRATPMRVSSPISRLRDALGTERDLKALLDLILTQARRITSSDAGSLYLVETAEQGPKRLRFRHAQTYSKPEAPSVEFTIRVDRTSLAGYTAGAGEAVAI